jgi:hypothetical protein
MFSRFSNTGMGSFAANGNEMCKARGHKFGTNAAPLLVDLCHHRQLELMIA